MDKKNTIIGVILLLAAMYFMYDSSTKEAAAEKYARAARAEQTAKLSAPQEKSTPAVQAQKQSPFAPDENIPEKIVSLENEQGRGHKKRRIARISEIAGLKRTVCI